ncbi:hypothetical protein EV363DRAFT_1433627 [Boletus edulis]|nr:hypothetical protein EV363DRAFT_1433627 [Boletus edulis]
MMSFTAFTSDSSLLLALFRYTYIIMINPQVNGRFVESSYAAPQRRMDWRGSDTSVLGTDHTECNPQSGKRLDSSTAWTSTSRKSCRSPHNDYRILDVQGYVNARPHTGAVKPTTRLGLVIPDEVMSRSAIQEMVLAAIDTVAFSDNIMSSLEQRRADELHNMITSIVNEYHTNVNGTVVWVKDFLVVEYGLDGFRDRFGVLGAVVLNDTGVGLHGSEFSSIHFDGLFDDADGDRLVVCHVSRWSHRKAIRRAFSSSLLSNSDEFDNNLWIPGTNEWKNVPRQLHEIGFKINDQLKKSFEYANQCLISECLETVDLDVEQEVGCRTDELLTVHSKHLLEHIKLGVHFQGSSC